MTTVNGEHSADDLANRKYIRYDSGVEQTPPNEEADIQAVADMINKAQVCHCIIAKSVKTLMSQRTQCSTKHAMVIQERTLEHRES